jgi:hypothetical protein
MKAVRWLRRRRTIREGLLTLAGCTAAVILITGFGRSSHSQAIYAVTVVLAAAIFVFGMVTILRASNMEQSRRESERRRRRR